METVAVKYEGVDRPKAKESKQNHKNVYNRLINHEISNTNNGTHIGNEPSSCEKRGRL